MIIFYFSATEDVYVDDAVASENTTGEDVISYLNLFFS